MVKYAAISREKHASLRWKAATDFKFAAGEATVPIVAAELAQAVASMPTAFIQKGESFELVGMLSVTPGRNLFVGPTGAWLAGYTPALLRFHPFRMLRAEGHPEAFLCIDEDSGLITDNDQMGEPFFVADGAVAPGLQRVLGAQHEYERSRLGTVSAVAALQQAGLIAPWPIKIGDGSQGRVVNGLFRIDEIALNTLSDDLFLKLRATGALSVAYGQMFSMTQIGLFKTLSKLQAQIASHSPAALPDTLDKLFDRTEHLELKFD